MYYTSIVLVTYDTHMNFFKVCSNLQTGLSDYMGSSANFINVYLDCCVIFCQP